MLKMFRLFKNFLKISQDPHFNKIMDNLEQSSCKLTELIQNNAQALYKLETRTNRVCENISHLERQLYGIKMDHNHLKMVRDDVQGLITAFEKWQKNALVNHDDIETISKFLEFNAIPLVKERNKLEH